MITLTRGIRGTLSGALQYSRAVELWILDPAPIMGGGQAFALRLARHLRDHGRGARRAPSPSELAERAA